MKSIFWQSLKDEVMKFLIGQQGKKLTAYRVPEAIQCSTRQYRSFFGKARKCEIETHAKWLTTGQKYI